MHYNTTLAEKKGNCEVTWAILNNVLLKQHLSVNFPTHLVCIDKDITNKTEIENKFNSIFTNVDSNVAYDINSKDESNSVFDYFKDTNENTLFLKPVVDGNL